MKRVGMFKPTLQGNVIEAGELRLAELDDGGHLIFADRYRNRCLARGSAAVAIDILDLLDLLLAHYGADGQA